jgi:ribonuclease P protein component
MPYSFPKARRLTRRAEFLRVYDQGTKVHGRFMTLFAFPNRLDVSRLGIAATRKMGDAVRRNRAKRRVREMFRTMAVAPGLDLVVVPRRELVDAPWRDLQSDMHALLARQQRAVRRRGR